MYIDIICRKKRGACGGLECITRLISQQLVFILNLGFSLTASTLISSLYKLLLAFLRNHFMSARWLLNALYFWTQEGSTSPFVYRLWPSLEHWWSSHKEEIKEVIVITFPQSHQVYHQLDSRRKDCQWTFVILQPDVTAFRNRCRTHIYCLGEFPEESTGQFKISIIASAFLCVAV